MTSAIPSPVTSPFATFEVKFQPVRALILVDHGVRSCWVPRYSHRVPSVERPSIAAAQGT
ncbi:hypothetical protein ABZ876_33575 [Streptomyces sp. NPDC046931]|uniref:hypothetical protein n=1 Tax=Streptomyces sp. NPDC046931 TaxID=3154806 RepID=UPI0033D8C7A4